MTNGQIACEGYIKVYEIGVCERVGGCWGESTSQVGSVSTEANSEF